MKKHQIILSVVLFVLALVIPASQLAQDASAKADKSNQESPDRAILLGFLRTINTAEIGDFSQHGSYASWPVLLAHQSEYLNAWLASYYPHKSNVHFGGLPEILPAWNLRLNVHPDGRGYDVLLEDSTDKTGYAALSDERGVIRECNWLQ